MARPTVKLDKDSGKFSGRVQLTVVGFKHQNVIDVADIVKAVDVLPDAHLEGLDEIRYDPHHELQTLLSAFLNRSHLVRFQAEFIPSLRSIILYEIHSETDFFHTLYHEIGHHVYHHAIDSQLRREWVREVCAKNKTFVSQYVSRNACEDFAECYAFYKVDPDRLRAIPSKYWFIKEKVFQDFEPEGHYRDYRF